MPPGSESWAGSGITGRASAQTALGAVPHMCQPAVQLMPGRPVRGGVGKGQDLLDRPHAFRCRGPIRRLRYIRAGGNSSRTGTAPPAELADRGAQPTAAFAEIAGILIPVQQVDQRFGFPVDDFQCGPAFTTVHIFHPNQKISDLAVPSFRNEPYCMMYLFHYVITTPR